MNTLEFNGEDDFFDAWDMCEEMTEVKNTDIFELPPGRYIIFLNSDGLKEFIEKSQFKDNYNPVTKYEVIKRGLVGHVYYSETTAVIYTDVYYGRKELRFLKQPVTIYKFELVVPSEEIAKAA